VDEHQHDTQQRALRFALVANGIFLVVELAGGVLFGSLALLADGAHMVSDVAALSIAMIAQRLAIRPHTRRHTYGLQRAEVIGAQANAVLLLAASAWIVYEAIRRIGEPTDVQGLGLLIVASAGLVTNVVSAIVLERSAGHSLNMRAAVLHMTVDAAGSAAAIAAGIGVLVSAGLAWIDPAASLLIVALVVWSAVRLLRDATSVLMEATPRGLDPNDIERFIAADAAVEGVHHVHVWNLASDVPALSAHVVIAGERTLHEAQIEGDRIRAAVLDRYGIEHTTFELECHDCES
jgi:cobalt-zinc-cadmium efflux system protein